MRVSRLDLSYVYDPFCRGNERMIMKVCGRDWMLKIGKRKSPNMLERGLNLSEVELVITLATWGVDSKEPPIVIWEFTNAWVLDKKLETNLFLMQYVAELVPNTVSKTHQL